MLRSTVLRYNFQECDPNVKKELTVLIWSKCLHLYKQNVQCLYTDSQHWASRNVDDIVCIPKSHLSKIHFNIMLPAYVLKVFSYIENFFLKLPLLFSYLMRVT